MKNRNKIMDDGLALDIQKRKLKSKNAKWRNTNLNKLVRQINQLKEAEEWQSVIYYGPIL